MTIREIAAKTNMSTDTLRYYERIGLAASGATECGRDPQL